MANLKEIFEGWKALGLKIKDLSISVQYMSRPPQPLLEFCKAYGLLASEIYYLEDKDGAIKERIQSFNDLKHWTIPPLHNQNLELKSFDEWRKEYEEIINVSIQKVMENNYINELVYYSAIDKLIVTEITYSKFVTGVRVVIDDKCKEGPNHVQLIKNVE